MLATIMCFGCDELTSQADVEHGCGLGRRADRRGVEAALVGLRELPCTLGDVVDDREGGAPELVGQIRSAAAMTQLLDDDVGKVEKVESDLISFKAFVIEGHAAAIGRARKNAYEMLPARRATDMRAKTPHVRRLMKKLRGGSTRAEWNLSWSAA